MPADRRDIIAAAAGDRMRRRRRDRSPSTAKAPSSAEGVSAGGSCRHGPRRVARTPAVMGCHRSVGLLK